MEADKILSIKFFEKNISLKPKADKYKNGFNRPVSFMNNDKKNNPQKHISKSKLTKYKNNYIPQTH